MKNHDLIFPRLLRLRDAPKYQGMDRNRFSHEVRPFITEIPIGSQGIAFDRHESDQWTEQYKSLYGRPDQSLGEKIWDVKKHHDSSSGVKSGTSIKRLVVSELLFLAIDF